MQIEFSEELEAGLIETKRLLVALFPIKTIISKSERVTNI